MEMRSTVSIAGFSFHIIIIAFFQLHNFLRSANILLVVESLVFPHAVNFDGFKDEHNFDKLDYVQWPRPH